MEELSKEHKKSRTSLWAQIVLLMLSLNIFLIPLMLVFRGWIHPHVGKDVAVWEVFIAIFGILYAIIIGLLIVEILRRYHILESIIERELNAIEDIRDFRLYLDKNTRARKAIREKLLAYVDSVINKEWAMMKKGQHKLKSEAGTTQEITSDTTQELRDLMKAVKTVRKTNDCDLIALELLMNEVAQLTTHRTERILKSRESVNPALLVLIIFMSVSVLFGLYLVPVDNAFIHGFMINLTATVMLALLLLILDLDHPFGEGFWQIEDKSFKAVAKTLIKDDTEKEGVTRSG